MAYEGFAPYPSPVDQADRELVEKIVSKIKSQGIFDQFRQDCLADVDTKPAYKHLQERVNGSVSAFLKKNRWKSDLNKTQLRESLRHHVQQGYFHAGVDRIVDQVVNAKIYSVFVPKVEDMVYETLGIEKPKKPEKVKKIANPPVTKAPSPITTAKKEEKPEEKTPEKPVEKEEEVQKAESLKKDVENSSEKAEGEPSADLLPNDLDPVSPASVVADDDRDDSDTIDETPFLLATIKSKDVPEASNASKLSGMSDLSSHGTVQEISSTTNSLKTASKPILPKLDNFSNLSEKLKHFDPLSKATVPDKTKPISEDETSSASNLNESESNGKDSTVEFDRNLISEDSKSSISDFKKFKDKTEDQEDDKNKTKNDSKPEENPEDKKVQKENTQNSENDDKIKKESSKKSSEKKSESRSRHDSDRKDSKSSSSRSRSSRKDEKSRDKSKDDKYKSRDDRHRSERKSESDKKDESSKSDKKDERKSSSKYKEKRSDDKKEERKKDEKKREDKRKDDEKKKDEDKKRDDKRREDDKKRDEKKRDEKRKDEDKKKEDYKRRDDEKKKDDEKRRDDEKKKDDDKRRDDAKNKDESKRRDDEKKKDDDKRRDDEKRESRKRRGERCSEKSKEWRHSSDRDNSGGQSGKKPSSHSDRRSSSEKNSSKSGDQKSNGEGPQDSEISEVDMVLMKINSSIDLALKKPRIAKNIHEARKIDKQRHSLEEKNENRNEKPEKHDFQNVEEPEKNEVQNTEKTETSDQNEFNTGTCSVRLERIEYQEQNYDSDKNETKEVDELKHEICEINTPVCEDKIDEFHGFDSELIEKFDKETERKFNICKIKKLELYKSFFSLDESSKTIKSCSDYEFDTNLNIKPSSLRKRKNSEECTQIEKKQRRRTRNSHSIEDEESENECCDSVDASSMTVMLDNLLKETDSSIINKKYDDDNMTTNQKTRLKSKNVEKAEPATEVACSVSNEKRSKVRNSTRTLQQRYDNSDLYKPKSIGFSSRRSRALSDSSSKTDNVPPERKRAR